MLVRNLEKTLRDIRPGLRLIAPQTYFVSWGFGVFNILAGLSLFNFPQQRFLIAGAIGLKVWSVIFIVLGVGFVYMLRANNWRGTRLLHLAGVVVKTAWLLELVARSVVGKSFILVCIWALLLYLQIVTYIYFTPVENRDVR